MYGSVPKIWDKARVYIIGGGPSVSKLNPEVLKDKRVIATNNAYRIMPWADVLYFMDDNWYDWHKDDICSFNGLIFTTMTKYMNAPRVIHLKHGIRNGVDIRPGFLSRGASSGQGAMNIGIKLGATELVLLGFDMRMVDGKHNYHNDHKREMKPTIYAEQHMKSLRIMVPQAQEMGITIVNCTPSSAMNFIPIEPLEKWL